MRSFPLRTQPSAMADSAHLVRRLLTALLISLAGTTESVGWTGQDLSNEIDQLHADDLIDLSYFGDAIYGMPDKESTGTLVSAYDTDSAQNPEELGTYLEGDILIPLQQNDSVTRNGILAQSSRWPGAVVPYEIKGQFATEELAVIKHAFRQYHAKTCVRFKLRTAERDYISIVNGKSGCWSSIGRLGGRQEVNLQAPSCLRKNGTAIHELMHVLGFFHEQNRHERDDYVRVLSENIKSGMLGNFDKSKPKTEHGFGVTYDYGSVMHYSPTSFSKNGQHTLKALMQTPDARLMGQRSGFSKSDIRKINAMYKCK